ncbi:exonuclease subunit SbcD [Pseudopedobacter sp.]|uniref:metallophosphoesterase family protein n=1 Tax=Pseudopedobacter sp. TaxID=1936787 RepID=UPI00333E6C16
MRILHTADWHLGKKLERISRMPEQIMVMDEIVRIANEQQADVVIVAGDLFDNFNPATEAVELLYRTLKRLTNNGKRLVVAIAGNHDSPDRVEAPDPLAKECGIIFIGYPYSHVNTCRLDCGISIEQSEAGFIEVRLPKYDYPLRLIVTPYASEYRLKTFLGIDNPEASLKDVLQQHWQKLADKYCDEVGVNMLVTHLFMMKKGTIPPEEPEDEKPILHIGGAQAVFSENVPQQIQYVALGHLHRFQQIDHEPCPIVYSSSPLSYSFSEAGQTKYVTVFDILPDTRVKYEKIALTAGRILHRKRFETVAEALDWLTQHPTALVELTLVTPDYLRAEDRKMLFQNHDGIVALIPEIKRTGEDTAEKQSVDLSQNMDELFVQYFKSRFNGQAPNEDIINLFREIKAEQIGE